MDSPIYSAEEDSYLMPEILKIKIPSLIKKNPHLKFLEIGAGSGINLETALFSGIKKENIFSCDINPKAVKHCRKLGFNCIQSDLFSKIKGKYDVIIFNPPYLPEDSLEPEDSKLATTAGKNGNEIIIKFVKDSKSHLNKNGKIFLITSSLSKKINFKDYKYHSKKLKTINLFFEKLIIWELE